MMIIVENNSAVKVTNIYRGDTYTYWHTVLSTRTVLLCLDIVFQYVQRHDGQQWRIQEFAEVGAPALQGYPKFY